MWYYFYMKEEKKKILMIATGGTIASGKTADGLTPELSCDEILSYVPEINEFCIPSAVQAMNIDSTNINVDAWLKIAAVIEKNYELFDGFVICHGTDTMAYTAAVLSYLIQNSPKPIVITGSQKPIDTEITDAKTNLSDSFEYCASKYASGVQIVFDGKVIKGTRAKKMRTKSYNAFSSINYPYSAIIQDGRIMQYDKTPKRGKPKFYHELSRNVGLFKLVPSADWRILDKYFELHDAVVIESFGTGGIPMGEEFGYYDVIEKWRKKGKILVMCTQVVNEGSDMTVYKVGKSLKEKYGFLESYDMTPEAVLAKLMWILACATREREVKKLFYKNVADDILYTE